MGKDLGGPQVEALPPTREKDDAFFAAGVVGMFGEGLTKLFGQGGGGGAVTTLSKTLILNVDHTNNRDPVEVVGGVEGEEVGEGERGDGVVLREANAHVEIELRGLRKILEKKWRERRGHPPRP